MELIDILASDNYIFYNKRIAKEYGVDEAILLGALCSYQRSFNSDWFYREEDKIAEDTALTVYAIRKAKQSLQNAGILKIEKRGLPAKHYFKIIAERLFATSCNEQPTASYNENVTASGNENATTGSNENATTINNNKNNNKYNKNISHPLPLKNQAKFFEKFPSVVIDSYSPIMQELTEEDWGTITEQFEKSEWLRVNIKTLSQLLRIVKKILAGSYAPFEQVKRYETAEEAEKRRKEEERQKRLDYFNSLPGFKWE